MNTIKQTAHANTQTQVIPEKKVPYSVLTTSKVLPKKPYRDAVY